MLQVIESINGILWDYILLFVLLGFGIYITIRLGFPQFTRLFPSLMGLIRDIKEGGEVAEGEMTPLQSLTTAIAAQVGTGNIIGVATAIASGGPGAAFWMLVSGFFGMPTIFAEAVLAQKYRTKRNGEIVGGPAYYIEGGFKNKSVAKVFAVFFAIMAVISLGFVGILVQSNAVVTSFQDSLGVDKMISAIILLIVVVLIIFGGVDRIGKFTEIAVPVMGAVYIFGGLLIIVFNIDMVIPAIRDIFVGAFKPEAIMGGALGITMQSALRFGLARGLFSNEAGMGSTPHSHAVSKTNHPVSQGLLAMIGVFMTTFVICSVTVIANMLSGSYGQYVSGEITDVVMTQNGFASVFGSFGGPFLSIALSAFSLTTIIGWAFFAEANVKFLFNNKKLIPIFRIFVFVAVFIGQFITGDMVWQLADLTMGLMALPNIIALFILTKDVIAIYDDYKAQEKAGGEITYNYDVEVAPTDVE